MINPAQIPDEVVEAALSAYNYASSDCYTTEEQDMLAAIAAALAAWEGMRISWLASNDGAIVLPLPQQASDDQ
jgi:hypothetical protein